MARKPGNLAAIRKRASRTVAAVPGGTSAATAGALEPAKPKPAFNFTKFAQEVRAEARKITWTSYKETWITSVLVFLMVAVASIFFFFADWALQFGVSAILKLANAR